MTAHFSAVRAKQFSRCVTLVLLVVPGCLGTEGDNPYSGPVDPSPCKGQPEYAMYLASQRSIEPDFSDQTFAAFDQVRPTGVETSGVSQVYETLGQALVTQDEMPLALECLQWELQDNTLALTMSNFMGGCEVTWTGGAGIEAPGHVVVQLDNENCSVAACGNCAYDTTARVSAAANDFFAPDSELTQVTLALADCEGQVWRSFEWDISLKASPDGIVCSPVRSWVEAYNKGASSAQFSESQLNLYAECGTESQFAVECSEDRSCVDGYCVPACITDSDCPLDGALTCQDGACLLP